MLAVGANLGPYRVLDPLGRGGMAAVFRGYQPGLDRYVAIKVLPSEFQADPEFRERFRQEARAVARLRHPAILNLFDFGEEAGAPYLVTELLQGGTLLQRLGRPLSRKETRDVLAPIAEALDFAHAQGILHRDVKPSNILFTAGGEPVLGDFGLAKIIGTVPITHAGSIVGTPEYMAPELCNNGDIGPAADRYALGVVAYQMLTGQLPFEAETPAAVLLAQVATAPPPAREINPSLDPDVEAALSKALAKDPDQRFPTAVETIAAITGEAVEPEPPLPVSMWVTAFLGILAFGRVVQLADDLSNEISFRFAPQLSVPAGVPPPPPDTFDFYLTWQNLLTEFGTVFLLGVCCVAIVGLVRQRKWARPWATLALGAFSGPYFHYSVVSNLVTSAPVLQVISLFAIRSIWHPMQPWLGFRAEARRVGQRLRELTVGPGHAGNTRDRIVLAGMLLIGFALAMVPYWVVLCLQGCPGGIAYTLPPDVGSFIFGLPTLIPFLAIPATAAALLAVARNLSWQAPAATVAAATWLGATIPLALPVTAVVFWYVWRPHRGAP